MRAMIGRQLPLLIARRPLSTEKSRRAFRSSLLTEKLRASTPSSPRNTNQNPFPFVNERNVIMGIIAANGLVFVAWKFSYANLKSNMDQRFLWFMTKHFSMSSLHGSRASNYVVFSVVSWDGVVQNNRVWTLLTSAFSHFDLTHFLINNFVLYSFGNGSRNSCLPSSMDVA